MDSLQHFYDLLNIHSAKDAQGLIGLGLLVISLVGFLAIVIPYGFPEQVTDPREDFRKHPIVSWSIVGATALIAIIYFGVLLLYPGVL